MRILYVATVAGTLNFFAEHIRMLQDAGCTVELAANTTDWEGKLTGDMKSLGCPLHHIPFSRSSFSKDNFDAYKELKKLLEVGRYDIIHTHTPNASAIVRLACRKLRKTGTKVFYTAHGFHFYKGAPMKNWLVYYPVERFLSRWTDVLLTMNREDYDRARTLHAGHVEFVHGVGVELEKFGLDWPSEKRGEKRAELGIGTDDVMVLSVGELIHRKNHETVIRAVAELHDKSIKYVICGDGPLHGTLDELINELGVREQVKLLGKRADISEINQAADIFALPSYQEGLPVALMEAMAAANPVICSRIRGCTDLVEDGKGGLLCDPEDVAGWGEALRTFIDLPDKRAAAGCVNAEVMKDYTTEKVISELRGIYGLRGDN